MDDNNGLSRRRQLFADMWSDPSGRDRGGAGAKAKGFAEFVVMRSRVTDPPAPTAPPPPSPLPTPTPSPPPTAAPTDDPTPSPTDAPVTPLPTAEPLPRNDRCTLAKGPIQITPQGFGNSRAIVYDDTTAGARTAIVSPDRCNRITNSAPGVWYTVVGTGERMTASLCWPGTTYDSKITVYRGDCDGVMTCINANDDASGNFGACQVNRQASRVQWESEDGVLYYLLMHGFGTRSGPFQLNVINHRPLNDKCEKAESISPGDTVIGTTFQANFPFGGDSTNCGGQFGLIGESNSVWYRTVGTGGRLQVSTCNPQTATNFDTKLHVFEDDCKIGSCIGGNDNYDSPQRCSLHEWDTVAGKEYYILVHGFLTSNGMFELSLKSV